MARFDPSRRRSGIRARVERLLARVCLAGLGACAVPMQIEAHDEASLAPVRRVVVMPFEARSDRVSAAGVDLVGARVLTALSESDVFELISPVDVQILLDRAPASERAELARAFGADAFLIGRVERFEGRVRADGVAQGPGWVAFDLMLESANGRTLWRGRYAERQRGWIEDLSGLARAYARGFRWADPAQLATYGSEKLIRDLVDRVERLRPAESLQRRRPAESALFLASHPEEPC